MNLNLQCFAERVLVHLRDGRQLLGVLRSYDQYGQSHSRDALAIQATKLINLSRTANLVLTQTKERLFHPPSKAFAEKELGIFLIRGENVVLLGEIVSLYGPPAHLRERATNPPRKNP